MVALGNSNQRKAQPRSGFNAVGLGNHFADWVTSNISANEAIKMSLDKIRANSRNLAINEPYMKRFIKMVENNVIGHSGIKLQMKAKHKTGELDLVANKKIEGGFKDWAKMKNASVTRKLSWLDIQNMALRSLARDGEIIIRKVRGFDNPFKFALQVIEADHLQVDHNANLSNGNRIRMGVEIDEWGGPVAYHLLQIHPGDSFGAVLPNKVNRVPADEIIHLFLPDRVGQVRGVPWAHTALTRIKHVGGLEEAELIGARATASKMGFLKTPQGEEYKGDEEDSAGNTINEFSPGVIEKLPQGYEFEKFDPGNPSSNFESFLKAMLRAIASGLCVSYHTLANDLTDVNFSSIRSGTLEEREVWKALQVWTIEQLHELVFEDWLLMALLTKQVDLPMSRIEKFKQPVWRPRGWPWVDPKKDVDASVTALNHKLKSRSQIVAEEGNDYEEVLTEIKGEEDLAQQIGVDLKPNQTQKPKPENPEPEKEDDDKD